MEDENAYFSAVDEAMNERYILRLFVTGTTSRSTRAIENMRKFCESHLQGRYSLEVIDIYQHPEAAVDEQIIAAPTLIKLLPGPLRRIIGDLSQTDKILHGLDLTIEADVRELVR